MQPRSDDLKHELGARYPAFLTSEETFRQQKQAQTRSQQPKGATSECFVSQFPSQVREITSPPPRYPSFVSDSITQDA